MPNIEERIAYLLKLFRSQAEIADPDIHSESIRKIVTGDAVSDERTLWAVGMQMKLLAKTRLIAVVNDSLSGTEIRLRDVDAALQAARVGEACWRNLVEKDAPLASFVPKSIDSFVDLAKIGQSKSSFAAAYLESVPSFAMCFLVALATRSNRHLAWFADLMAKFYELNIDYPIHKEFLRWCYLLSNVYRSGQFPESGNIDVESLDVFGELYVRRSGGPELIDAVERACDAHVDLCLNTHRSGDLYPDDPYSQTLFGIWPVSILGFLSLRNHLGLDSSKAVHPALAVVPIQSLEDDNVGLQKFDELFSLVENRLAQIGLSIEN